MCNTGFLQRLRGETGGNVLAIAAAAMIPFTIMVGSALDLSVTYMARGKLQNACDAAALAARQSMTGTNFNEDVEAEGDRFFAFNFPVGTAGTQADTTSFELEQDEDNASLILGEASAQVPTSLIRIIGIDHLDIAVDCDATRDLGHNDIVMVLDVTGSMNCPPGTAGGCDGVEQTGAKMELLRQGTEGLWDAMAAGDGSITRYGIVPYSHTVNIGRSLGNDEILKTQKHLDIGWKYQLCDTNGYSLWNCVDKTSTTFVPPGFVEGNPSKYVRNLAWNGTKEIDIDVSKSLFNNVTGLFAGNKQGFRESGQACIEERPTIDASNPAPSGKFFIRDYITRSDIDMLPKNASDAVHQFGRYDPSSQKGYTQFGCPSEATRLSVYNNKAAFTTAVDTATVKVTGGTYHDVGMLWGTRLASRTGFFKGENFNKGDNITAIDGVPVNTHIVFMTDGKLDTGETLYSAMGVQKHQVRVQGSGSTNAMHQKRFESVCNQARGMGITIWVIALDVSDTDGIKKCATSDKHFYTSDGSDLYDVFKEIGRGIGNLRLTR